MTQRVVKPAKHKGSIPLGDVKRAVARQKSALDESKSPETAMDGFVDRVRHYKAIRPACRLDTIVRRLSVNHRQLFTAALQDPRYIAYCHERDYMESEGVRICSQGEQAARLATYRTNPKRAVTGLPHPWDYKEQDAKDSALKECAEGYALQAAHCAAVDRAGKQDRKEESPTVVMQELGSNYHKTWWSDGTITYY